MHALVIAAPREARIEDIPVPEPGPTEVRVRMEGCGICGSNLPVWEGRPWFDYPIEPGAPGHEGWGQIDAVGTEVTGLEAGTRVAVLSYHAFAEYDIASAAAVVPIPPALSSVPFPGEALGCAMNVLRRACVQKGDLVAIVGIGFLGAVLTRLCVERGATVIAISRRKTALELARASGAWLTFDYDDGQKIVEEVGALSDGAFCDVVLEVTGKQGPLDLATELTRPRGRLVIAGYHQDGRRTVDMRLWNWRGIDVINAHEREPEVYVRGIREAIDAASNGAFDPVELCSHPFDLERIGEAFEAACARDGKFMKAWVRI